MSRIQDALSRARENKPADDAIVQTAPLSAFPVESSVENRPSPVVRVPAELESFPLEDIRGGEAETMGAQPAPRREPVRAQSVYRAEINPDLFEKLVTSDKAPRESIEQYRKLAAVLHHAQVERQVAVLMITSALPGEGKTLTSANLALTLSESYRRRVLLMDADLRRPSLHEIFSSKHLSGLTEAIQSGTTHKIRMLQVTPTLSFLPAGRPTPDPMGSLTSSGMKQIINEGAAQFDWVIIDTPPVGLLPDANLLVAMADAALLVIRAASTPCHLIRKAADAIGRDRILGTVLNRAENDGPDEGYSYYGKYGYGYQERDTAPAASAREEA